MAETPKKSFCSPKNSKNYPQANAKPSPSLTPATPQTLPPRRSTRRTSLHFNQTTPLKATDRIESPNADTTKSPRNVSKSADSSVPKTSRKSIFKAEDPGTDSQRNGSSGFELSNVSISAKRSENSRTKDGADFVEVGVSFSPLSPDKSESTEGRERGGKRGQWSRGLSLLQNLRRRVVRGSYRGGPRGGCIIRKLCMMGANLRWGTMCM
ncbi:hypothetical protein CJ030_MR1G023283 [Morella rubra]|uniref:Uncharacterized protein n=1 Tax=Morella rubra TaxID=262757 RepID=A0A6A1WQV8_9ROSI|nr:hypothetical protein CJ030_MR1G023283 [Morella rubra]